MGSAGHTTMASSCQAAIPISPSSGSFYYNTIGGDIAKSTLKQVPFPVVTPVPVVTPPVVVKPPVVAQPQPTPPPPPPVIIPTTPRTTGPIIL